MAFLGPPSVTARGRPSARVDDVERFETSGGPSMRRVIGNLVSCSYEKADDTSAAYLGLVKEAVEAGLRVQMGRSGGDAVATGMGGLERNGGTD